MGPIPDQAADGLKAQLLVQPDSRIILLDHFQDQQPVLSLPGLGDGLAHQPLSNPMPAPFMDNRHSRHPAGPPTPGNHGQAHGLVILQGNLAHVQVHMILPEKVVDQSRGEFDFDHVAPEA
jgi:hypothetical protein